MLHPAFDPNCGICHLRRYRVYWPAAGYALLCGTCDWGVTLNRQVSEKPTWWHRVTGGEGNT